MEFVLGFVLLMLYIGHRRKQRLQQQRLRLGLQQQPAGAPIIYNVIIVGQDGRRHATGTTIIDGARVR